MSFGQISITSLGTAITQDFNSLASTGTSSAVPSGWSFLETGTGSNTTYAADPGSATGGNTYSYGSTSSTERAFGGLQSGSVNPLIGASFTNNTSSTITSLTISYIGEQWRLGTAARVDRLDFQYSTTATSLSSGTWVDANSLDFTAPTTSGTLGALDGNATANKTAISFTLTGLTIANGNTFWFRWNDFNASGADDGLAVDDFSATFNGTALPACTEPAAQPTSLTFPTVTSNSIAGSFTAATADKYLVVRSTSNTLTGTPADGTVYTTGTSLGGGIVVANGTATTFTDASLSPVTQYFYFVFALNDQNCTGGPNYNITAPLTGNATTTAVPACTTPAAPTALILNPANTSVSGSFTGSGASKYLVVISTTTPLSTSPATGTVYTAGQTLGNGTVVTYTAGTTFSTTGLTPATQYYFYVYGANDACTGQPFYSTASLDGNITTTNNTTGIPTGYYSAATGLSCAPLKSALNSIITDGPATDPDGAGPAIDPDLHTQNNYGGLDNIEFLTTDDRLNDAGTATVVWDMYSDNPLGPDPYTYTFSQFNTGGAGEGDGWNKEHSFPNSWFSASSSTANFPGADLFHIYPTDVDVNSLRGNFPFGEVATATTTTQNGSKLGTSSTAYTGNGTSYTGPFFEPIDAYKGDFARSTFYMVTRYQAEQPAWEALQSTGDVVMDGTTYPSIEIDYLRLLLKWHNNDPVSAKEIERNNEVYGYQQNRNPFIDHPEFVGQIWSSSCGLVLPITLLSFDGKLQANEVLLKWVAENPDRFNRFEIERSIDGIKFDKMGILAVQNNSTYNFSDKELPNSKVVYYRLKMIDNNGVFSYSTVVTIKLPVRFSNALVYPNPTIGELNIKLYQPLFTNSTLQVLDVTGRMVKQQSVSANNVNIQLDVNDLSAGRYFIKITNNKQVINQSFVVIK